MSRQNEQGQSSQAQAYYYYSAHPPPAHSAFPNTPGGPFPITGQPPHALADRQLSHLSHSDLARDRDRDRERPESPANFLRSSRHAHGHAHAGEDSFSVASASGRKDSTKELMAAYAGLFEGAVLVLQYKDQKTIIKRPHKLDGVMDEAARAFDLNGPDARVIPGIVTPVGWIPIAASAYDLLKDASLIILRPYKNDPVQLPPYSASAPATGAGSPAAGPGGPIAGPIAAPVPTPGVGNTGSHPGPGNGNGGGANEAGRQRQEHGAGKAEGQVGPRQHLG